VDSRGPSPSGSARGWGPKNVGCSVVPKRVRLRGTMVVMGLKPPECHGPPPPPG
jgi:hypothetical protein